MIFGNFDEYLSNIKRGSHYKEKYIEYLKNINKTYSDFFE